MKSSVRFSRRENKPYWCDGASSQEMDILGNFLRKSVDCNRITQADKVQEDIVELWDDLDPHETGPAFRIPNDQYLKMIKLWKEL